MKAKIILLISLCVTALFLVSGCAPKEAPEVQHTTITLPAIGRTLAPGETHSFGCDCAECQRTAVEDEDMVLTEECTSTTNEIAVKSSAD